MWSNPQEASDLVIFTDAIFNGKLRLLCSAATGPNQEFLASKRKLLYDICTINLLSTLFPAQVRQTAIFLVLHRISSKVKPNSSSRFNLESRSVILANITTEIFQNQYKLSLKNSKLVNGNGEVICSIEINSLWCNIFAWNNLTKS